MLGKHYLGGKGESHYYERRHYFRSVNFQKQSFEALIRYRIQKEVNINDFSATMKTRDCSFQIRSKLYNLRRVDE